MQKNSFIRNDKVFFNKFGSKKRKSTKNSVYIRVKGGLMNYDIMKDDVIKKIFTNRSCGKRFSAALIANVLNVDERLVLENLEYLDPNISNNKNSINSVADTVLENDKLLVNIEFNYTQGKFTDIKNGTYIVQLYIRELHSIKDYPNFKPIIQINIDNYDYFKKDKFLYSVKLMETNLHITYSENIQIYHLNLSQLRKNGYNENNKLEKMLYLFVCKDLNELDKVYKGDELMSEVKKEVQKVCNDLDWSMLFYDPKEIERNNAIDQGVQMRNIEIIANMQKAEFTKEQILLSLGIDEDEYDRIIKEKK